MTTRLCEGREMAESDRRRAVGTRKSPNVAMLTLHNVRNYGSVLQAFATQRLIENAGAQCTVIDFRRQGIGDDAASYLSGSRYSRIPLAPRIYAAVRGRDARRRSLVFRDFIARRVHLTSEHYGCFEDLDRIPFQEYEAYCVGSDQVWNIDYNRDNRPFYLSFLPDGARRFSFSSSIGMVAFPKSEEGRAKEALSLFSGLSVREARAYEYLTSLGLQAEQHVDPTLALPDDYWNRIASAPIVDRPYIAVYQLNRNPLLVDAATRKKNRIAHGEDRLLADYAHAQRQELCDASCGRLPQPAQERRVRDDGLFPRHCFLPHIRDAVRRRASFPVRWSYPIAS